MKMYKSLVMDWRALKNNELFFIKQYVESGCKLNVADVTLRLRERRKKIEQKLQAEMLANSDNNITVDGVQARLIEFNSTPIIEVFYV